MSLATRSFHDGDFMRFLLFCLFFLFLPLPGVAAFRVLSGDREKVDIRFTTDIEPVTAPQRRNSAFFSPDADGIVVDSGGRRLPSFSFRIALPGSGSPQISVISLEKDTVSLRLLPTDTASAFAHDTSIAAAPAGWLSTPKYESIGGMRTALYTVSPVSINDEAKQVTIVRDVSFRISHPMPTVMPSSLSLFDHLLLKSSTLNSEFLVSSENDRYDSFGSPNSRRAVSAFSVAARTRADGSAIQTSRLVRMPVDRLLEAHGGELSTDRISLYAVPRFGLDSKAKSDSSAPAGFCSVPVIMDDIDQDGFLDHEDQILAYVQASSGWWYDSSEDAFEYRENKYNDERQYVLVLGSDAEPLPMEFCPQPSEADTEITSFPAIRRYRDFSSAMESDNRLILSTLDPETALTIAYPHADYDHFDASFRLIADSKGTTGINVFWAGNAISNDPLLPHTWTAIPAEARSPAAVKLKGTFPDSTGAVRVEAVELRYNQLLDMEGLSELEIFPPKGDGVHAFTVRNLPEETCYALRVPQNDSDICLLDRVPPMISTYSWYDSTSANVRYHIIAESSIETIDSFFE